MPNRIIKESICTSDKLSKLSDFEFRLWVGLITQADDTGRGDARPAIIKGHVFPLRERVTIKDIDGALHALAAAGCVSLYTVGGKPYFLFPSWSEHQRIRDCKPKFPGPDEGEMTICGELPQVAASCGLNPIQSNTNPNPNPNTRETRADKPTRFSPPAVDEVKAYCLERGNGIDPQVFVDYYTQQGWKLSNGNQLRDWKAAIRTWEGRERSRGVGNYRKSWADIAAEMENGS